MKTRNLLPKNACASLLCLLLAWTTASAQDYNWGGMNRYAQANKELPLPAKGEKRVVFMGNSITEGWASQHPGFFKENNYIGRGISGQTSYQFLLRFRQDVINLKPALVVINAGTNDVAENAGPYNEDYTMGNIISMVQLAQANGIKVILTSVLPAARFGWRPEVTGAAGKIAALNSRIKAYAKKHRIPYVDYYKEMVTGEDRALNPAYSNDGVHPTGDGYLVMERLIKQAIDKAL